MKRDDPETRHEKYREGIVNELLGDDDASEFQRIIVRRAVDEGLHKLADGTGEVLIATFLEGKPDYEGTEETRRVGFESDEQPIGEVETYTGLAFLTVCNWHEPPERYVFYYEGELPERLSDIDPSKVAVEQTRTTLPYGKYVSQPSSVNKVLVQTTW